jgi:diguanylate cyclase (GGDEF)-like protein
LGIRGRLVVFLLSALVVAGVAVVVVGGTFLGPYLDSLEAGQARNKADQIRSLLEAEFQSLGRTAEDWAYWDDSVRFLRGENPAFADENLDGPSLANLAVDSMVFVRPDGTPFWAGTWEAPSQVVPSDPAFVRRLLETLPASYQGSGQGFLWTNRGPMVVALRPSLPVHIGGGRAGTVILVRAMDKGFWTSLGARAGVGLSPSTPAVHDDLSGFGSLREVRQAGHQFTVLTVGFRDLTGALTLAVTAPLPRVLEEAAVEPVGFTLLGNLFVLCLLVLAAFLFLTLVLIAPLRTITGFTRRVSETGDYHLRLERLPPGELGVLASDIHSLLGTVETGTQRLEALAATDGLTGLSNRRSFDQALDLAWKVCRRENRSLGLILVDVDHFKRYNDLYGHRSGDVCLKAVAQVIQDSAKRPSDVSARYGGEEFAVILPNTDLPGVVKVANDIRAGVVDLGLRHDTNDGGLVTVSLGAAAVVPGPDAAPGDLVETTDRRLYGAKNAGRNRVCSGEPAGR